MRLDCCFQVVINLTWGSLSEISSVYPCSIDGQPRSGDVIVGVDGAAVGKHESIVTAAVIKPQGDGGLLHDARIASISENCVKCTVKITISW